MVVVDRVAILHSDGVVYDAPRPGRHHDVILAMHQKGMPGGGESKQGFILSDGRFVGRKEAAAIALSAGQCKKLTAPPRLYSEDLW